MLKKWSKKKILLCPVCGKPYEYCHGEVKTPYFRHMDKAECEDKYSESETEEHLNGKRDLYEWVKRQVGVTNAVLMCLVLSCANGSYSPDQIILF